MPFLASANLIVIVAPLPEAMKIGSRAIDRIARTGELTPPGRTRCAEP